MHVGAPTFSVVLPGPHIVDGQRSNTQAQLEVSHAAETTTIHLAVYETISVLSPWVTISAPAACAGSNKFRLTQGPMSRPREGEVLVRVRFLSVDPANRLYIKRETYRPQIAVGDVILPAQAVLDK